LFSFRFGPPFFPPSCGPFSPFDDVLPPFTALIHFNPLLPPPPAPARRSRFFLTFFRLPPCPFQSPVSGVAPPGCEPPPRETPSPASCASLFFFSCPFFGVCLSVDSRPQQNFCVAFPDFSPVIEVPIFFPFILETPNIF